MFGALLDADGAARVIGSRRETVVIGLGNSYRRDDGVGIAVADALAELRLPGVRVVSGIAEPMGLVDAWSGAGLAVVVDAAVTASSPTPGLVRRCTLGDIVAGGGGLSSHSVDLVQTYALGQALGLLPAGLVLFTIDVVDTGHGVGMTPQVADAVAEVVGRAAAEIAGLGNAG